MTTHYLRPANGKLMLVNSEWIQSDQKLNGFQMLAQSHQTLITLAIDQWSMTTSIKDNQDHLMMTFTLRYIAVVIAIVIVTLLMSENCEKDKIKIIKHRTSNRFH